MTRVGLRMAACGQCRHPEIMTRAHGKLGAVAFPSLAGLIEHPTEGLILFDTGYDPAFLTATAPFPERFYRWATPVALQPEETVAAWLARLGRKPDEVRAIVLSHFHGDHVAGLHHFPKARIFAARAGYSAIARQSRFGRVASGVLTALLPADLDTRARWFEDCPAVDLSRAYAPFTRGADLFGDGSLIAVELPGHCPGHWGLALHLEDGRDGLLIGDAAWSLDAVIQHDPPPRLTTALLGKTQVYRETFAALHRLSRDNDEMLLLPSHCAHAAEAAGLLDDA